ncbi:MAG: YceI family protein [Chloroflexota bacterium]
MRKGIWVVLLCGVLVLASCAPGQPPQNPPENVPSANTPTPVPEEEPTATVQPQTDESASSVESEGADEAMTFQIVADRSEARFIIQEVLLGNDKTVVGATSQVTGEITVVPSNPSASQIGIITINARDFKTDSSRRNRAIQRQVLLTAKNEYQFITFEPLTIESLPQSIGIGDTFSFSVTGELSVLDTIRSETFEINVTVISEQELTGLASTTILYADYGITVPKVPIVASVEDEVQLELEFIATKVE